MTTLTPQLAREIRKKTAHGFEYGTYGAARRGNKEVAWEVDIIDGKPCLVFFVTEMTKRVRYLHVGEQRIDAPDGWSAVRSAVVLSLRVQAFLESQGIATEGADVGVEYYERDRKEIWRFEAEAARELAEGLVAAADYASGGEQEE